MACSNSNTNSLNPELSVNNSVQPVKSNNYIKWVTDNWEFVVIAVMLGIIILILIR